MSPARRRQANPNLGAYFGIVASAFVSLVVGLAMFEQLGWKQTLLAQAMMLVPLALYLGIAVGARTLNVEDFFVCGRRVPPVYNGAVLGTANLLDAPLVYDTQHLEPAMTIARQLLPALLTAES